MFEENNSVGAWGHPDWAAEDRLANIGGARTAPVGTQALRAMNWNELTARLNAVRDLRREIEGQDATFVTGAASRHFVEIASRYLVTRGTPDVGCAISTSGAEAGTLEDAMRDVGCNCQPPVNPVGLVGNKGPDAKQELRSAETPAQAANGQRQEAPRESTDD